MHRYVVTIRPIKKPFQLLIGTSANNSTIDHGHPPKLLARLCQENTIDAITAPFFNLSKSPTPKRPSAENKATLFAERSSVWRRTGLLCFLCGPEGNRTPIYRMQTDCSTTKLQARARKQYIRLTYILLTSEGHVRSTGPKRFFVLLFIAQKNRRVKYRARLKAQARLTPRLEYLIVVTAVRRHNIVRAARIIFFALHKSIDLEILSARRGCHICIVIAGIIGWIYRESAER